MCRAVAVSKAETRAHSIVGGRRQEMLRRADPAG
jgi:hypothetical protein